VVTRGETLWFLGTMARMKLEGEQTGGRFAIWESVLPFGAAPPLHSHPQDETFYVLEGEVTVWLVEPELLDAGAEDGSGGGDAPNWVDTCGRRLGPGAVMFAPGGTPHSFRAESDTVRMLVISTPAGIEDLVRGLGEPAQWPWLQPPPDGPRVPAARRIEVEARTGMVTYAPPPSS
jgi:quercetin dioxygenase-like cupin family protein